MEEAATSGMSALIAPAFNLAVLIVLLVVKVKQPLRDHVRNRHLSLKDELESTRQKLSSAQEKYDEFTAKLKTIDAEAAALREQARADAQATQQRIATESKKIAASIVTESRSTAQNLYSDLKSQLLGELGQRVLERAEAMLKERLTGDDRVRIRQEFSQQVERAQ
jgi:F-type H+-transporting ATPase subunit b